MTKVSIIVPAYNVEDYIQKCLESLVNQTLQDIEIIVVNDGSTDQTKSRIEKFMLAYPEKIKYLENDTLKNCKVFDYQNNKEISVYDMEKAEGKDPYEMFLGGPLSLVTIENEKAKTDKELIIFRDSFGSSIAPLLIEGYKKITLVDIRYIHPNLLGNYIEFNSQDVLFLYSTSVLNNSETIK